MPTDLSDVVTWSWKVLVTQGVIAVILGIVALVWPNITILALVVIWGVWALVDGIAMGAAAFRPGPTGQRILFGIMALIGIAAAFFAFFRPGLTAAALTWVLGIWLIVRGLFELFGAFSSTRSAPRWLLVLGALLDLLLGILFVANPGTSVVAIIWLIGIVAIAWGIVFIVLGLIVRSRSTEIETALSPT
ncbi:MAG: DUF308 domain-containing protein [Ornithinibacter sp.]